MALFFIFSIASSRPGLCQSEELLATWQVEAEAIRDVMSQELWPIAVERSTVLLEAMVSQASQEAPEATRATVRELLGVVTAQRAVSSAGRGDNVSAVWDLYVAASLNPAFLRTSFAAFGQPGLFLDGYRELAQGPKGGRALSLRVGEDRPGARPPRLLEGAAVGFKEGVSVPEEPADPLWVEFVIDRDGVVRDPLVVGDIVNPLTAMTSLWVLRTWRFAPGRVDGEVTEFLYRVGLPLTKERVEQTLELLDRAYVAASAGEPAVSGEPASALAPSATAEVLAAAETTVEQWAAAWSRQDVDAYLSFYVSDFRPAGGETNARWREQRRERIEKPQRISVTLSDLRSRPVAGGVEVSFEQVYQSDSYRDQVRKVLLLVKEGESLRVASEVSQ